MTLLRVTEIFDSLQGEGYWTGVPMSFVRLAGCNAPALGLGCTAWCDTRESWDPRGGEAMEPAGIAARLRLPRVCLTGGEPLLQLEGVCELMAQLHGEDVRVHVETNGTIDPPADDRLRFDWAVVSPKPPTYEITPGWDGLVDELKLVVDEDFDEETGVRLAEAHSEAFVCIQPVWEGGRVAVERAMALVMGHPDWRLSLQVHKSLGIR